MQEINQRAGDCKSSIHRFDSDPRLHFFPSLSKGKGGENASKQKKFKFLVTFQDSETFEIVDLPVTVCDNGSFVTLKFSYKSTKCSTRIYLPLDEISGSDIRTSVENEIKSIEGNGTIGELFDDYLEFGTGQLSTRKKNISNGKDYLKRDGISLDEPISRLAETDELGRTLPERWEELYNLPHKMRQVRSIFGRKNLSLFKRKGWDTTYFGNFIAFVPQSVVSQPFSTSDAEVEHIINFFNKSKVDHPIFYDIYLLAFGCGLRQSEIYQVRYEDFTTFNGQHYLNLPFATKRTKLKSLNGHVEKVPVSQQVFEHFTSRSSQGQVISGANRLHKRFVRFLKEEVGITENKACHRLRKILGARLATEHGIYHASKQLRNSVSVCEKYYSDLTSHRNELMV